MKATGIVRRIDDLGGVVIQAYLLPCTYKKGISQGQCVERSAHWPSFLRFFNFSIFEGGR